MENILTIYDVSNRLFVILFFPSLFISLGVFFWGVNCLWRTSIENRDLKRKAAG
ncbi:MAG: hypothetical protein Kow0026_16400 [Oricola sp.]